MPLRSSDTSETSSPPSRLRLPRISDAQLAEIERYATLKHWNLNQCPTCGSRFERVGEYGDRAWPEEPTYRYMGQEFVCDCVEQSKLRRHYILAGIPSHYWTLGENEYYGDPEAWSIMMKYLDNWEANKRMGLGLEFHSPEQGTGQTMLTTYLARQLVKQGEGVQFARFREIMGLYLKPYEVRKEEEERLWYSPVLILDDVGAPLSGEQRAYFAVEFENVMRSRIEDDLVTIMTTNLPPDKLDEYYPRTYSLLAAKQTRYEMAGDDARRSGKVQRDNRELALNGEVRPLC